jgi:uncharacterized protein YndB with AHSA1/START domain
MMCNQMVAHPDRIERRLTLNAPRGRVWASLTDAAELSKWFAPKVDLELVVGGSAVFEWEDQDVTANAVVEEIEEPSRFVFRWEASHGDSRMTRVEFQLDEVDGGTQLTLFESGFSSLPPESRADHEEGWDSELAELQEHLASAVGA